MSDAIAGRQAVLKRSGVAIAEVLSITGPGMTRDFIDVTNLASTGGYREFISGYRDGGELTFTINFIYAGYNNMKTDFDSDSSIAYQVILPDGGNTTLSFNGYVTTMPLNITPDEAVTCDITIKITGEVSLAA